MRRYFLILSLLVCSVFILNAQIIISNDTAVCGLYQDTLQALSSTQSSMFSDDQHDVLIPIGFTFDFYGLPYDFLVISGNGYITFDATQANQWSPYSIFVPIPNPGSQPENAIMAPWHDINTATGGAVYYGSTGIAPNRKFVVTWCQVPMFSCSDSIATSQVVLYEGSDKIEMFIQDKPICIGWNGGNAVQGLVDATSTNADIVTDPLTGFPRNFPVPWSATNEGWEFIPNGPAVNSYNINSIPYVPIIAGLNTWSDSNGNILATGPLLPVDIATTNTYYASITGSCASGFLADSIVITVTPCFDISLNSSQASCLGNDGSITCTPDTLFPTWDAELLDINGNLLTSISNISNSSITFSNLVPGTYIVNAIEGVSNAQDTIVVDQIQINLLVDAFAFNNVSCNGGSNGEIRVIADGGSLQYSYYLDGVVNINPYPYDSVFYNLSAGTYIISVVDNDMCMVRDTVEITEPSYYVQALAASKVAVCYGSSDGLAIGSAAGGTPGYSYEWFDTGWNSFSNNDTAFGLSSGSYYLVATDVNGCTGYTSVNVVGPQTPLITSSQQFPLICKGDNSGMIVGDAAGSWAPYQYHWFDDQGDTLRNSSPNLFTRDTLDNLSAGVYALHIYDSQDCFVQETINISEPDFPLSIDSMALINNVSCYGDSSGRARLYVSGGDPNYTCLWDNGETGLIANMLTSGYHTVSVIDSRGCEVIDSIFVPENQKIESSITISSPITCYGLSDGEVSITSTGGASFDYTYFWSNGYIGYGMSDTATGLLQGSYYIITRDGLGCEVIDSIYMSEPDPITMEVSELDWIDCFGYNNGLAYSSAQGGTSPYIFDWDNGQWVGDTVSTLTPGIHTVIVTDSRGCTATDTVLTHEPTELYVNIDHSQTVLPYCAQLNINTSSLSAIAGGGTPSYSYVWNDNTVEPQTTTTASALTSYNYFSSDGSYTITVIDNKGCTATASTDTLQTFTPTMQAQVTSLVQYIGGNDISCFGEDDGAALVDAWGAHSPYIYQWYGPNGFTSNNDSIDHLVSGTYSVTVEDTNDCMVTTSIYLTEPSQLYFTTLGSTDESCNGACDGELSVSISGGIAPYTGVATENSTNNIITSLMVNDSVVPNICSGHYTINITDANTCSSLLINGGVNQQSISTNIFTQANIDVGSVVNIPCNGTATGSVDVSNPNPDSSYNYSWQNINNPGVVISTGANATSLFAGTYVLYAGYMNYSGCITTDTVYINELDAIEVVENIINVDCYGDATGSISAVQILGGTSPYSLQWGPNGQNTNLVAGTYTLTVVDANSCQHIDTFEVVHPQPLNVNVSQNGFILTVNNSSGGVQPYLYSWREQSAPNVEVGTGMNYVVSSYGTYYLQMVDANGCILLSNNFEYTPTDVENQNVTGLTVYPNPFKEYTTIDFGQKVSNVSLKIFDVLGKVVDEYYLDDIDKFILERGDKKDGIYFIEVDFIDQEISTVRLILE